MATARQMNAVLQTALVPAAHAAGFTGTLPHLVRTTESGLAVVSLQMEKRGGGLRLELGFIPTWLRALRPRAYAGRARAGARAGSHRVSRADVLPPPADATVRSLR
jgi:hypothetical protein